MSLYKKSIVRYDNLVEAAYINSFVRKYTWTLIGTEKREYPYDMEQNLFDNPANWFTGAIRVNMKSKTGRIRNVLYPKQPVYPILKKSKVDTKLL